MIVGVHDHLGRAVGRLEGGEAVVEHGDLEARRTGSRSAGPPGRGRAQRAVVARRQEGAVLAVDRVDDLLAAQLLEAQLAHARSASARAVEDQRAAVVFDVARDRERAELLVRLDGSRRPLTVPPERSAEAALGGFPGHAPRVYPQRGSMRGRRLERGAASDGVREFA